METLTSYLVNVADNANTHNCLLHGHAGQCCMDYGWKWWNFWKKTSTITSHCCSSLLCRSHLIWIYSCSNAATGLDAHHFIVSLHTWAPMSYIVSPCSSSYAQIWNLPKDNDPGWLHPHSMCHPPTCLKVVFAVQRQNLVPHWKTPSETTNIILRSCIV